jgi:CRISPR-associated Csx2 family protein
MDGYQKTTYRFVDSQGKESDYTGNVFLEVLLEAKYRPIAKIILLGTTTSSWDALLADIQIEKGVPTDNTELWTQVLDACRGSGITDVLERELEMILSQKLGVPVIIKTHEPKIDEDTIPDIFPVYNSLIGDIEKNTDILLDITHGFRSMPLFVYQALQFSIAGQSESTVELVYGEYIREHHISFVRNLSLYWHLSTITEAKNLFETVFDGTLLSQKIERYWGKGAKAILRLSEIVECNFSLQIDEFLRQLKNALKEKMQNEPAWVSDVRNFLDDIHNRLSDTSVSKILRKYSKLLEEKGLITQAVIALQVALETAVAEKYAGADYIGDYEWIQNDIYGGKLRIKNIRDTIKARNRADFDALLALENMRNKIAHGGSLDRKSNSYPSAASIPAILKKGNRAADIFFEVLEKE